jgi:alpha-N-arabinofuranosidase
MSVAFEGVSEGAQGTLTVLTAPDAFSYSDVGSDVVKSTTTDVTAGSGGVFEFELPDLSVSVLEVKG